MKKRNEIGKISFDFDKKEIEEIVKAGRLGAFVEKATELFRLNLKAEMVNGISSGETSLVHLADWEYGTGPIGPFPPIFAELDVLRNRINDIEASIKLNR